MQMEIINTLFICKVEPMVFQKKEILLTILVFDLLYDLSHTCY